MKRLAILLFIGMMTIPLTALAAQEVCPSQGRVESVVDGDIDGVVLPAGTMVCIKAGTLVVHVVADGVQTLAELIGNGKNISHYTVDDWPIVTTTTIPPTTTTAPETTTTTAPETTTTTAPETTTTTIPETTTTTIPETTTTEPATTTTEPVTTTTAPQLPNTGIDTGSFIATALVLLMSGGLLLLGVKGRLN